MRLLLKTAMSLMFCVALSAGLSACGTTPPPVIKPVVMAPTVPASIRTCKELPAPPEQPYKQREVAGYIVALRAVARNCKGNLGAVDKLLLDFETEVVKAGSTGP